MPDLGAGGYRPPEHQPLATLDKIPPEQGPYYTVLDTTKNVRLLAIMVQQTNEEEPSQAKTVKVRLTIDGNVLEVSKSLDEATWYVVYHLITSDALTLVAPTENYEAFSMMLDGRSVKVELCLWDTVGAEQTLRGRVLFAKW